MFNKVVLIAFFISFSLAAERRSEIIQLVERIPTFRDQSLENEVLPEAFSWSNKSGINYLTKMQNQHIPQYCGSCWAFAAASALSDRIQIARGGNVVEFYLSVQYILNCAGAGSCLGGDSYALYHAMENKEWPYDTANPYIACSSDSKEGFCPHVDTKCSALNTARTCPTFGKACVGLNQYPNATIEKYGNVTGADNMKSEIYNRGPIVAYVNAVPLLDYHGGVYDNSTASKEVDHGVSIVGWGKDQESGKQYWIVRNSWGQYWGEMGYFKLALGENQLGIEGSCFWATPASYTEVNFPCNEDGSNCKASDLLE